MSNNNMTELRGRIVRYFAIATFAVAAAESAVDSIYSELHKRLYPDAPNAMNFDPLSIAYLLISLLFYVIGGIVFYRLTQKAIQNESKRQISEQNLIFAAIAHDLKTPMTSVMGFAKALSDGKIAPDEQAEIYDIIYRKSKSMNELTDLLFEYAKFGTDEYRLTPEDVDICVLTRDIAAENYCELEEHNIELEADIPDTPITVSADRKEIKRAVSNLLLNARKHNPEGIKVLISVKKEDNSCIITVADNGNEIPADMNIFEPFVTENSVRTVGKGSGLGLAITKRIIDCHGGKISLESRYGEYTKAFIIKLEVKATDRDDKPN